MTTQLVDPTMIELSGVTTGANISQLGDGAQGWIVLKSLDGTTPEETSMPGTDTPAAAAPAPAAAAKDGDPAGTPAATATATDAPTVDVAALQAELDRTKALLAEATKGKNPFADDEEDEEKKAEKALDGIADEAARTVIAKALRAASEDRQRVAKMLDAEATREAEAIVEALPSLPTGDKFTAVVKALRPLPEWAEVERVLRAAETAVAKAATDAGSLVGARRTGGDADDQIEAIAKGYLAAGTAPTIEQAREAAYRAHPELVAAARAVA